MKLAIVVQRFGNNVVGGAETHCRRLAEKLAERGHEITVYTTTAFSYRSWAHMFPEGDDTLGALKIKRYKVSWKRWPRIFGLFNRFTSPLLRKFGESPEVFPKFLHKHLLVLEKLWFMLQGPWCPKLVEALSQDQDQYERIIFFTYLYYPTVYGLAHVSEKAILVPTAHDEDPFFFSMVRRMFESAKYGIPNSESERKLIQTYYPNFKLADPAGCGLEDQLFSDDRLKRPLSNLEGPFVLYLGRVSRGKGVHELIQYFLQYIIKKERKDLKLLLVGESDGSINFFHHPQIRFLGFVSDNDKCALIQNASIVVNPSAFESLSLIVLEAVAACVPVLVNSKSEVLQDYADTLPTVFSFSTEGDFMRHIEALNVIQSTDEFSQQLKEGRKWVADRFSWDRVLRTYEDTFEASYK